LTTPIHAPRLPARAAFAAGPPPGLPGPASRDAGPAPGNFPDPKGSFFSQAPAPSRRRDRETVLRRVPLTLARRLRTRVPVPRAGVC
jgi:hypothetical protein